MMDWFARPSPATASAENDALVIRPVGGRLMTIRMQGIRWAMFLHIGEAFLANETGWWILPNADPLIGAPAVALSVDCPGGDAALRGPLRRHLEAAWLIQIDLSDLPAFLRVGPARTGFVAIDAAAEAMLRAAPCQRRVHLVDDLPTLP